METPMPGQHDERSAILEYAERMGEKRTRFGSALAGILEGIGDRAAILDIETGGLNPSSPIYEWSVQHGLSARRGGIAHGFGPMTSIDGSREAEVSDFTARQLQAREKATPGVIEAIDSATGSQRDVARNILNEVTGRDVWVQNLQFERRFIHERLGGDYRSSVPSEFDEWAHGVGKLESASPRGAQLFSTTPGIKRQTAAASSAAFAGNKDNYLKQWEGVFGEFVEAFSTKPQAGVTRAFDVMDLSKSVMAMAQQRGYMANTGELFSGTSAQALGQAMFGVKELHTAGADNALQGNIIREMFGAGLTMRAGNRLSPGQAAMFERLGRAQPAIRQRNAEKTILSAYQSQQQLKAIREGEAGAQGLNADELKRNLRVKHGVRNPNIPMDVLQADGSREREWVRTSARTKFDPRTEYTMDLDEFVSTRKAEASRRIGESADWDAAYKRVRHDYIDKHMALSGNPSVGGRLAAMQDESLMKAATALHELPAEAVFELAGGSRLQRAGRAGAGWIRANAVQSGIALGAAVAFGAVISGHDDDYNSIEGLRHGGIAGATRHINTEFGSGYQGVNPRIRESIATVDIKDYQVEDADTISAVIAGGDRVQVRLAGIDAPEIEHASRMAGRVNEAQPYGQEAAAKLRRLMSSQSNIKLILNTQAKTSYGRLAGTLVGDKDGDLNLQLIRQGAVKALPFGKASERTYKAKTYEQAEQQAYDHSQGMWNHDGWRAIRTAESDTSRKITNTTMTQVGRLYDSFSAASKAIRLNSQNDDLAAMQAMGGTSDFNILEGLRHGWYGANRRDNTDFGSGYVINKTVRSAARSVRTKAHLIHSHRNAVNTMKRMMQRDNMIQHHLGG